jgi:hypothetical protein
LYEESEKMFFTESTRSQHNNHISAKSHDEHDHGHHGEHGHHHGEHGHHHGESGHHHHHQTGNFTQLTNAEDLDTTHRTCVVLMPGWFTSGNWNYTPESPVPSLMVQHGVPKILWHQFLNTIVQERKPPVHILNMICWLLIPLGMVQYYVFTDIEQAATVTTAVVVFVFIIVIAKSMLVNGYKKNLESIKETFFGRFSELGVTLSMELVRTTNGYTSFSTFVFGLDVLMDVPPAEVELAALQENENA